MGNQSSTSKPGTKNIEAPIAPSGPAPAPPPGPVLGSAPGSALAPPPNNKEPKTFFGRIFSKSEPSPLVTRPNTNQPRQTGTTMGGSRKKKMKRVKRNKTNKYKKYKK